MAENSTYFCVEKERFERERANASDVCQWLFPLKAIHWLAKIKFLYGLRSLKIPGKPDHKSCGAPATGIPSEDRFFFLGKRASEHALCVS